jgi:SIR2-like domain
MVVDDGDYRLLLDDRDYKDFLTTLFRERPTLFIGFSFLDPAISSLLDFYRNNFGPDFPLMHVAVVPESGDPRLAEVCGRVNIRVLTYKSKEDHDELWRAIRLAHELGRHEEIPLSISPTLPKDLPQTGLHRVVAFAYARSKTPASATRPALEMVEEGILLSILDDEPSRYLEKDGAIERLRKLLRVDESTAANLFSQALQRLKSSGDIEETERYVRRKTKPSVLLDEHLTVLARAVLDRLSVIHKLALPREVLQQIKVVWERLFIARAWDLAPQYAGSVVSRGIPIDDTIEALIQKHVPTHKNKSLMIRDCFLHLIDYPERAQAQALAEISRTAIAVELLLSSPRRSVWHAYTLPTKLYFDASVLLPAIVKGHPTHEGNVTAILRLKQAVQNTGQVCELAVGTQFLEEILVHRIKAIDMVSQLKLEDPERLAEHIIFYGAENTNVFVGAFSSQFKGTPKERHSFTEFLRQTAPYSTEAELVHHLRQFGISTEKMTFIDVKNIEFNHIFSNLLDAYEGFRLPSGRQKDRVLVQHEAQQLTRLFVDAAEGRRSVFVTADARLQRAVQASDELEKLTGNVLSQIGFIGLVDVLVGLEPDREIFTRLIWATPRSDVEKQIRDYLVTVTLRKYDEAMAMAMPDVITEVVTSARREIELKKDLFRHATDVQEAKTVTEFLDRLENQYFTRMRAVLEKRDQKRS